MFLPFRNVTRRAEQQWLVSGAPLMLEQALGQFRDLSVVPEERMEAAKRRLGIASDAVPDATQLRRLANETGAWTAVTGNVFATGPRVRITLQALDVPTSRVVVRAETDIPAEQDPREAFDRLSVQLLEPAGVPATGASLAALTTKSLDAYRAYIRGLDLYFRAAYRSALGAFREAVRLDSTFALAWSSLALASVNAHRMHDMLNPAADVYRAIDRSARYAAQLPADQAALARSRQAFIRADFATASRIVDSLLRADPRNLNALEWAASLYSMGVILSRTASATDAAANVNRSVALTRQLLDLDPRRRMAYELPLMIYGFAGGLWWRSTWVMTREFTSFPFLLLAASTRPEGVWIPVFRDSITFMPVEQFSSLDRQEQQRLRRLATDRAMEWVGRWLSAGPDDAEAHLWASRIAELQGDYFRALREVDIADSLGIEAGSENVQGRRLSLLLLAGEYDRAGAYTDSLRLAGAIGNFPFNTFVDRRWTFGSAALLLSRRWDAAGQFAVYMSEKLPTRAGNDTTSRSTPSCASLQRALLGFAERTPEHIRSAIMDSVGAHRREVEAVPSLAPCADTLATALLPARH